MSLLCLAITLTCMNRLRQFLAQVLLRKKEIERYFIFPPHLANVSALPEKTTALPGHRWATLHCRNDWLVSLCASDRMKEGSIATCNMLPSRLMFTKSGTVSVAELFLSSIGVKVNGQSCWNILLSQQMLNAIIYCAIYNNFVFQQDSAQVHLAFNTV